MIRSALFLSLLAAPVAGCSSRFELFTTWTIDGRPAEGVCPALEAPDLVLRVENREVADGPASEELTHVECASGAAPLEVGPFADLFVDLYDGDRVFGVAGPYALAPASANRGYVGDAEDHPLHVDVKMERGRLRARLTVVGQSCGEAGASSFSVSVSKNAAPLEEDVLVQGEPVECADGEAWFELSPVELGVRYAVMATTTIDGVVYATTAPGEGVVPSSALTELTVDLDATVLP